MVMVQNWIEKGIAHCKNTEFEKGVECFDKTKYNNRELGEIKWQI